MAVLLGMSADMRLCKANTARWLPGSSARVRLRTNFEGGKRGCLSPLASPFHPVVGGKGRVALLTSSADGGFLLEGLDERQALLSLPLTSPQAGRRPVWFDWLAAACSLA